MKRKIQQVKRVLAGFLSAAMVFTMIPQVAFAEEADTYIEYEEDIVADENKADISTEVEMPEEVTSETEAVSEVLTSEEDITATADNSELELQEAEDENAKVTSYSIDMSGVDEDIDCSVLDDCITKTGDKQYSISANTIGSIGLSVNSAKRDSKTIRKSSIVLKDSEGNKVDSNKYAKTYMGDSVKLTFYDSINCDVKVEAQTTNIHKISFVIEDSVKDAVDEIEPILFSANDTDNPGYEASFEVNKKDSSYALDVRFSVGNSAKYTLTESHGKYVVPVKDAGVDYDYTVYISGKKTQYNISVNTVNISENSISYWDGTKGYEHTFQGNDKYLAGSDFKINVVEPSSTGKAISYVYIKFVDKNETKKYMPKYYGDESYIITIPAEDAYGDIIVEKLDKKAITYSVSFEASDLFSIISAPKTASAGEDYKFKVKAADWVEKLHFASEDITYNSTDDVYVISANKISDDIEIEVDVYATEYKKYDLSLASDVDGIKVELVTKEYTTIDGAPATLDVYTELTKANSLEKAIAYDHNKDLRLRITDSKSDERDDSIVTAKCNGVAVKVTNDDNGYYSIDSRKVRGNIEITVTPSKAKHYYVEVNSGKSNVEAAEIATKGKDYSFKVTPFEGYELDKVEAIINGKGVEFKKGTSVNSLPGDYVIKAADVTGRITIKVTTKSKRVKVSVENNGVDVALAEGNDNNPEQVDGGWIVDANKNFKIKAGNTGDYIVKEIGIIKGSTYYKIANGNGEVTEATISAGYLKSDIKLVVTTAVKYTLNYDASIIKVDVSSGNRAITVNDNKEFYLTSDDTDILFTVKTYDDGSLQLGDLEYDLYNLAGTKVQIGDTDAGKLDKNGQITIKKDKINNTIKFNPEAVDLVALVTLENYMVKDVLAVNKAITLTVTVGDEFGFFKKHGTASDKATDESHYSFEQGLIKFTAADAGKTVRVPATVNGKKIEFTFKVASEAKGLSIKGIKNNKATQAAGSAVEYQIVATPANANLANATVTVTGLGDGSGSADVPVVNGKFTLAAPVAKDKELTVEVKTSNTCQYTATITTTTDAIEKATPTISLVRATDSYIQVKLSAPKTVDVNTSGLHYAVNVWEAGVDHNSEPVFTTYTTDLNDNIITAVVNAHAAKDYEVEVQIKQEITTEAGIIAVSKKATKKMSTINPCVETKLGATLKTTKLTQGDYNVLAAVAKYGNKTTYIDELGAIPQVISAPAGATSTDVTVNSYKSNEVCLNVAPGAKPGKYVIRLTAKVPDGSNAVASTVDFPITVAERVAFGNTVKVTVDSATLYKPAGKQVTNTVKLVANKGISTKSVTMTLDNTAIANGITIKNGKITIPKNYAVRDVNDGDTVKVTLKDSGCAYNVANNEQTTVEFKIAAKPVCIAGIIVGSEYITNGRTVDYSDIYNEYIQVIDEYGSMLDDSLYTLKLSNNLSYDAYYGAIFVKKAGKSSITVAATDGSKISKTINFTIGTASDFEVMIRIAGGYNLTSVSDYEYINDADTVDSILQFVAYNGGYDAIDVKLSFKGAKSIGSMDMVYGTMAVLIPTAEETVITVNNLVTKEKVEYKIKNTNFKAQNKLKGVSYKNLSGKLYSDCLEGEKQNIVIDIKNLPKLKDGEVYAAKVQFDYSNALDLTSEDMYKTGYSELAYAARFYGDTKEIKLVNNQLIIPIENGYADDKKMIAGTYKFVVEIVKEDAYSGAVLEVVNKSTVIPVTFVKAPKATYALTASYKFGNKGKVAKYDYIPLTGKGTNASVDFSLATLKNANIAGSVNNFTDYFEIDIHGNLVVTDERVFTDTSLKNSLTGYVEYEVINTITGESSTVVTKINCKK